MTEFDRIEQFFAPLAAPFGFALRDDAAALPTKPGHDLILSKDMLVEGVHFLKSAEPFSLAQKALRVNISDLIAKGAVPSFYMLGLATTPAQTDDWFRAFSNGLAADQKTYGLSLLGGDSVRAGTDPTANLVISVTVFGYVRTGQMVRRAGARPGDHVFVTGTLGDAAGWLATYQVGTSDPALQPAYDRPNPPVGAVDAIRRYARASADISDGLVADADHIARASGVHIDLYADQVPASKALVAAFPDVRQRLALMLSGGDDYQSLCTVAADKAAIFSQILDDHGVSATHIGQVSDGSGVTVFDQNSDIMQLDRSGFTHF